jgi:hypothetical protein
VLAPCNPTLLRDAVYGPDFAELVRVCGERGVAVQTIKAITRGPWGSADRNAGTWYEPLTRQEDIDSAVWFVLGQPGLFLNTVGDRGLLPAVLDAAERFTGRPDDEEIERLVERARMTPLFVAATRAGVACGARPPRAPTCLGVDNDRPAVG